MLKLVRYCFFMVDREALLKCIEWQPKLQFECLTQQPPKTIKAGRIIWLILPHNEAFRGVGAKINALLRVWDPFLSQAFGWSLKVRTSWMKGGQPLQFWLRRVVNKVGGWGRLVEPLFS